ncbi:hypothetical protein [Breznakiella homolactica]|uniref:Uncharacterized protein n=1 Tax=Breznakiella homolactica TaxID=2798577 RepID=A0A7T7XL48_9SPIR|nr:hypothetical protein [Breznakiella homolactica]QQO08305.1 hypothetical protein JFL75_15400 [Breznakiella homolactica]
MRRYCIKSEPDRIEFMDILKENTDGYMTRVTRIQNGYEKSIDEFMTRELFELCLKTGFINEIKKSASSVA